MQESINYPIDEDARRRFELVWTQGKPEPIETFLPPNSHPSFPGTLLELVLIEQEMKWKNRIDPQEHRPRTEDYLARFPLLQNPQMLSQLVEQEFFLRKLHGELPELPEYQVRFPHLDWTRIEIDTKTFPAQQTEPKYPSIPGLEIQCVLGRGGMGVVYKANQTRLNRTVAIKQILSNSGVISAEDLNRFNNEALAVARLKHPNIIQVHEVGQEEGRPYLVLEYVEGGTLAQKLAAKPQPIQGSAEMVRFLALAVQAIHSAGLMHRDLKPGNILLTPDGTPKISDFGLTKDLSKKANGNTLTVSGAIVGTPSYMAPEQASGQNRTVGPAADIYALGAILYEMLTGIPPFRGETPMDTIMQVISHEPVSPRRLQPKIPRDLETICLKCLEKEPLCRYPTAAHLAEDINRFLSGQVIQARPVGVVERSWRWCRRKPAQAGLVILLVFLLLGALTGWYWWEKEAEERRQQLAKDAFQKQTEESNRRVQRRTTAENHRRVALGELHEGRFVSAHQFLQQARDQLAEDSKSEPFTKEIAEQFERVNRLVTFYRHADLAERLAFLENDQNALRNCETGLETLGVFQHSDTWWTHLPTEDLRPHQAAKLVREVDHQLTLLAGLWIKEGKEIQGKPDPAGVRKKVLAILKLGENYREAKRLPPSLTARILEGYCYVGQFQFDKIRLTKNLEPTDASDCYFVGIALYWAAQEPDDWISKAVRLTFPLFGVDLKDPKKSAERLLRKAVAEEPGHYWSHHWLGWCLMSQGDLSGAELVFTTCTTLRPEEGLAYSQRAQVLANLSIRSKEGEVRDRLIRRFEADANRAQKYAPHDWLVQTPLLFSYSSLGRQKEASLVAGRIFELVPFPHLMQNRPRGDFESMLQVIMPSIDFPQPIDPAETHSLIAQALLFLKKDEDALRRADLAAKFTPDHPRVHTVRGFLHLRKKEWSAAITEFRRALAKQPHSFLAKAGLGDSLELNGEFEAALQVYETLQSFTVTDGQRLAAYSGCYRNLTHLGRSDEAQKALARARAINFGSSRPVVGKTLGISDP